MKLTKSKLKQVIKEEIIKMNESSRFNREYNKLKSELQSEWRTNDQQTSAGWTSPEKITASIIQHSNMEWEDLHSLILDAVEEYNTAHEDKMDIDIEEVHHELNSMAYADYEDLASSPH